MSAAEWREFMAGQLDRFYPAPPRQGTDAEPGALGAGGALLVAGADPEEYAHERALPRLAGAAPVPAGSPPPPPAAPSGGISGALGSIRRRLTGKEAKPPVPAPPQQSAAPEPPAAEYEPEAELAPGVFYARKKPRFPRP